MSIHDKKDWLEDLAREWREAEVGEVREGDTVIVNSSGSSNYTVRPAHDIDLPGGSQAGNPNIRILQRAPEPERPEVVVASWLHDTLHERQVFEWTCGVWESRDWTSSSDSLVDPVPLVERPSHTDLEGAIQGATVGRQGIHSGHAANAVLKLL